MSIPQRELIAALANGRFHSGSALGAKWSVSRAAVSKAVKKLALLGLDVCSVKGKGYRLGEPLTVLEKERILSCLDEKCGTRIGDIEVFHSLPSTNSYLLNTVNAGLLLRENGFNICLAEMQTSGRGSRGRSWVSPYGHNIYISLLKEFPAGARSVGGLSLAISLALLRALRQFEIAALGLKWPNDLLINRKKAAGILIEIKGEALEACHVVIGIGVNLKLSAEDMVKVDQPWTSLKEHGFQIEKRNEFVAALISSVVDVVDEFQQHGFEKFLSEWSSVDLCKGNFVELIAGGNRFSGVGQGVDKAGNLMVLTSRGLEVFGGGEVSLRFDSEAGH